MIWESSRAPKANSFMSQFHARQDSDHPTTVAVVGEVLFDHFPDGTKVLGGAPFNVAWNLKGLGQNPLFVSAIGEDAEGDAILDSMKRWKLRTEAVAKATERSTGRVVVTMQDSEPSYEIPLDQSFDNLNADQFETDLFDSLSDAQLMYHGSLFFRTATNQTFFKQLLQKVNLPRFVDLNVRQPWFDRAWVQDLVGGATWVKLNVHELSYLSDSDVDPTQVESVQSAIANFRSIENLSQPQTFLVTCGEQGAYWIDGDCSYFAQSSSTKSFADSVGAGDAFSAAVINGIVQSQSPEAILNDAVRFAASACEIKGATSQDTNHYTRLSMPNADNEP